MLTYITWKWGSKYSLKHVHRLYNGIRRWHDGPFRFICVTDAFVAGPSDIQNVPIRDHDLLKVLDGCYVRLRMFDPAWQADLKLERFVCLDLDTVITGPILPLFEGNSSFRILHGGHFNPCPFNGSVMMIESGARKELWETFDVEEAYGIAHADGTNRGTDQTWIAAKAPDADGWTFRDGIYAFSKPGWPPGEELPPDARIVVFPGAKDPSKLTRIPWIDKNWR